MLARQSTVLRSASVPCSLAALLVLCACGSSSTSTSDPTTNGHPSTRGIAVAVGLNSVNPAHYGGWSGPLGGCEPDARDMDTIARDAKLSSKALLTQNATRQRVLAEIASAAQELGGNDLFVLSYSGHGGQVQDVNGDDPQDGLDETWCLFDGELLDDELYGALSGFKPGVRVLVLSDSCHSGTVLRKADFAAPASSRDAELDAAWATRSKSKSLSVRARAIDASSIATRAMPPSVALRTYRQNQPFYDEIGAAAPRNSRASVKCQALLISGCEDDQLSSDLGTNGLFTFELVQVWNRGAFNGGHPAFQQAIRTAVLQSNPDQAPAYFTVGPAIVGFEAQRPYTLLAP
jgi:hypothetical protein